MSETPRTDANIRGTIYPVLGEVVHASVARTMERDLIGATARLKEWEAAFETTNPAQAKAEHLAVLAKREALYAQVQQYEVLLERTSNELIEVSAENARLKDRAQ